MSEQKLRVALEMARNYLAGEQLPDNDGGFLISLIEDALGASPAPATAQLSDLVSKCIQVIEQRNSWKSEGLVFFELAPNIATSGDIVKIGKVREWRATLNYGKNLDEIEHGSNYFGATPEEAVSKALNALLRSGAAEDEKKSGR